MSNQKDAGKKPEPEQKTVAKKEVVTRTMDSFMGLVNRCNHDITVVLKKDSFVLAPSSRTGKDYIQADIVSVNGHPLQRAVSLGICAIIR